MQNFKSNSEILSEEVIAIRGESYKGMKIPFESYNMYLNDIFNNFSSVLPSNNREKYICKGIFKTNFLKYLCKLPIVVAEIIFNKLDDEKVGFLKYEQFADFQRILRFGDSRVVAEFLFDFLDLGSKKKILIRDIQFLISHISANYSIKMFDKDGFLEKEVVSESKIAEQICTFFEDVNGDGLNFKDFYDKIINGNHEVILFFFNYFFDNIGSLSKNLAIYEYKYYMKKGNHSSDSISTNTSSTINNKIIIPENKNNNINSNVKIANNSTNIESKNGKAFHDCRQRSRSHEKEIKNDSNGGMITEDYFEKYGNNQGTSIMDYSMNKDDFIYYNSVENNEEFLKNTEVLSGLKTFENKKNNEFGQLNIDDNLVLFGKDEEDNTKNKILENELRKEAIFEGETFISENTQMDSDNLIFSEKEFSQKHLLLLDNIIYLYDKFDNFGQYKMAFFLQGCNLRELPEYKINFIIYYSFTIFFLNDTQQTFYFRDKVKFISLITSIRKNVSYRNFFNDYEINKEIGKGTFGKVYKCTHLTFRNKNATKILKKNISKLDYWIRIKSEFEILKTINHPNIIKYIDSYENSEYYFIVLEYKKLGNLTNLLKTKKIISESTVKKIILQIANALQYLNSLGIVHRDIKPDNILIDINENEVNAKLSDFGLAKVLTVNETTNECCGSIPFCAPELLKKQAYNTNVDVWSLGILIYFLLSSNFPFKTYKDKPQLIKRICNDNYSYLNISNRSINVCDLIKECLNKNAKNRISIDEVLKHPWFE